MARFGGFFYLVLKTWPSGAVHDPALRGSEFNGFAGLKDCELFSVFQFFCLSFLTPDTRHLKP